MQVVKRDGSEVEFSIEKVKRVLMKVNERTHEIANEDLELLIKDITAECLKRSEKIAVEDIQNIVENTLMLHNYFATAKSYILFRDKRTRIRESKSKLLQEIAEKINASHIVNQNANIDEYSFGGRKGEATNELMKQFALDNCISEMAKQNHLNNEIYIHDLDSYAVGMHNCLTIPFDKLLKEGFNTRQADIRPAGSVSTAFQLVAVIFQLQSLQQFGGASASHLDWTMVPYVRKSFYKHFLDGLKYCEKSSEFKEMDKEQISNTSIDDARYSKYPNAYQYALDMTKKETYQAVEGMYHNLKN